MPRDGSGRSHNAIEEGDDLETKAHGTGGDKACLKAELEHTKHVAPAPDHEKGGVIEGLGAGGQREEPKVGNRGKGGAHEPLVDRIT
ncbi:hypothetical protein H2201_006165 [Coniosporium apollinis]|uniref:Hypervirulence associated protein TUDOR domain-containing protein n=2 Tax=Coniosporium TaxID=2810619 RepID=A0ABQ9NUE5_9PEZI|nr:hypothetical protein H2199_000283 [Cladosporium sp. JES 115]KAJ9662235.1 hypothetical protein H2201_006165 [Coniosporium apollinis]